MKTKLTILTTISVAAAVAYLYTTLPLNGSENQSTLFLGIDDPLENEVKNAFVKYVAKWGKSYATHDSHNSKYKVFKSNYLKVKQHNI